MTEERCLICPNCGLAFPLMHTPEDESCSRCNFPFLEERVFETETE